jgi:5-methylcytosine-specific restriction endonuclease McrA
LKEKRCYKCSETKKVKHYGLNKARKDGLTAYCLSCTRAYLREWKSNNKDKVKAEGRRYRATHSAAILERKKAWRKKNPARESLSVIASSHNKRARRLGLPGHLTVQDVLWIYEYYGEKCMDCGTRENLELDHVKPMSLGGANFPSNIQLTCTKCNRDRYWRIKRGA